MNVFLSAPWYVLGEIPQDHSELPGLRERAEEYGMPYQPELWGWGTVRRTEKSLESLAVESGAATLREAGVAPESVDALILCATRFPGDAHTHGGFVERVAAGLGISGCDVLGLTLNRCTNLLAGLRVAETYVAAGRAREVLVITTDRITDEATRITPFALFSDGAASCLVSATGGAYAVIASAAAHDLTRLDWSYEISSDLARRVNEKLLGPQQMKLNDIDGLCHSNIYLPVVVMKERQAGFTPAQLYTDNIARVGHCFAADPLINLVDRTAAGQIVDGRHYLLAASVPGSRTGVLLRKLPG